MTVINPTPSNEASSERLDISNDARRNSDAIQQIAAWQIECWQVTKVLGRVPGRILPAGKPASTSRFFLSFLIRLLRLMMLLRFSEAIQLFFLGRQHEADVRLLRRSGLFDERFYRNQFDGPVGDAVHHYLDKGANAGAWPHPLFDTGFYLAKNPDVRAAGVSPLLHYLMTWSQESRRPNPFFDPHWYAENKTDMKTLRLDPLSHYVRYGMARGADPSAEFDTAFYRAELKRAGENTDNPLAHFLHVGRQRGLLPALRVEPLGKPVELARVEVVKNDPLGPEVALFVTHSPDGRLKPHVRLYLEALESQGVDIVLIVASDRPFSTDPSLTKLLKVLVVRENVGFDFAAWAHLMRLYPKLFAARLILWLNDSLIGPVDVDSFSAVMRRVRNSKADIVGLTDNFEHGYHIQSFFLALKPGALSSSRFRSFVENVVSLPTKNDVIDQYEVGFAPWMQNHGFSTEVLFPARDHLNPSIFHWRALLESGFPFVKVMLIRDDIVGADKNGWREMLSARGYDVTLVDRLLTAAER